MQDAVGSLQEVVELILKHRPDILFLGDLVTSRDHIGRLKKLLESGLHDEWFVTTNINDRLGRPVAPVPWPITCPTVYYNARMISRNRAGWKQSMIASSV